jgi:hypothetical protein
LDEIESVLSGLTHDECRILSGLLEKVGPDRSLVCSSVQQEAVSELV